MSLFQGSQRFLHYATVKDPYQKLVMLYSNSPNANEKIMAYLYRRGFTISVIQKIISEIKQ